MLRRPRFAVQFDQAHAAFPRDYAENSMVSKAIQAVKGPIEPDRRLDSWKAISAFLNCGERTVRRWEKERALPIHRLPGAGRSGVFAYTRELSEWRAQGNTEELIEGAPDASPGPDLEEGRGFAAKNAWRIGILLSLFLAVGLTTILIQRTHRRVASASSAALEQATTDALPSAPPSSVLEAEDLYLKGRYYWNTRSPEGLRKAVDYFTQSIVKDPNYAASYIGLADCYNLLREYTLMPPEEAYPRALAAAQRAVALDDSSGEAHTSLAFVTYYWLWNADAAEREFKRAIELSPGYSTAHHWYSTFLMSLGRFPESFAQMNKAQQLDPHSAAILADKGFLFWSSGQLQPALQLLKQVEETEPGFLSPHIYLSRLYLDAGDNTGYLTEARTVALALDDQHALAVVRAGEDGLARGGRRGMLENVFQVQEQLYLQGLTPAYPLAVTSALLGRDREFVRYFQAAIQKREADVLAVQVDPLVKSVRGDPGYLELLKQTGLPPPPAAQ
jgi:tetratricopeptide (TPR) repeat protein